jgi:hypothetical protein
MQIIEYVDTKVIPNFAKQPKNTLEEIKKWNNILNFRKNTPEVKKIKEHVVSHMSQVYDNIDNSLQKASKKIGEPLEFVTSWREGYGELESFKNLVISILEASNPEITSKFMEYSTKFEALIKKFCSKIEDDTEKMRSQDQRSFEETTGRRIDLSLEEDVYAFVSPSLKADEFSQLLQRMKQFKLDNYFSDKFRTQVNEQLKIREITTYLRQILQSFMFHIEKVDEGLLDIVKGDNSITALMKTLSKKQEGDFLTFKDSDDAAGFLAEVN